MTAQLLMFISMKDLPNNIRALRKAKDWSLEMLAERSRINYVTLSKLELGKSKLHLDYMRLIAQALDCSPADLLLKSDNPMALDENEQDMINALRNMDPILAEKLQETVTRFAADPAEDKSAEGHDKAGKTKAA